VVEGSGAWRVIAAEADARDRDSRCVDVAPRLDEIDHRLDGDLVVAADREVVFAFALARPIESERCHAARQERRLIGVGLLLAGIEPAREGDHRRAPAADRPSPDAGRPPALVRPPPPPPPRGPE